MQGHRDTVFAVASPFVRSGVAIIRLSGPHAQEAMEAFCAHPPREPNVMKHTFFRNPADGKVIDEGMAVFFKAPRSFTGEDSVEFHTHGSRAVLRGFLEALAAYPSLRLAEAGEFTRRAVLNGKMDLTAAEGLADLIDASTEQQKAYALRQMRGELGALYKDFRERIVQALAWIEAYLDFPEEEIPREVAGRVRGLAEELLEKIQKHLDDGKRGERLREGYRIVLVGAPNAGKSSLLNRLAGSDVAIVSERAGTTRDVLEVSLDLGGYPVILADTAGLRERTSDDIEAEGMRRARMKAENADLVLQVVDAAAPVFLFEDEAWRVVNKIDLAPDFEGAGLRLSAKTGLGVPELLEKLTQKIEADMGGLAESPLLTRFRHREGLVQASEALRRSLSAASADLQAEDLRLAAKALGRLTGEVATDELLDMIFKDFCIGK